MKSETSHEESLRGKFQRRHFSRPVGPRRGWLCKRVHIPVRGGQRPWPAGLPHRRQNPQLAGIPIRSDTVRVFTSSAQIDLRPVRIGLDAVAASRAALSISARPRSQTRARRAQGVAVKGAKGHHARGNFFHPGKIPPPWSACREPRSGPAGALPERGPLASVPPRQTVAEGAPDSPPTRTPQWPDPLLRALAIQRPHAQVHRCRRR